MGEFEHLRVTYEFLQQATGDFSTSIRGSQNCYKGQGSDGQELAVMKWTLLPGSQEYIERLISIYAKIKHPNIMPLLGYFYLSDAGGYMPLDHLAFCFEYMRNGSLEQYLYDSKETDGEDPALSWSERYRIIKGICEGLKCLHMDFRPPIRHGNLTLKKILLDENMVPKIGIDDLFIRSTTFTTSSDDYDEFEYYPEYRRREYIDTEYDIYNLGGIILNMVGADRYSLAAKMDLDSYIEHVRDKWMTRLAAIPGYTTLDADCQQVEKCIQIALRCIRGHKRPTISEIVHELNQTKEHINDSAVWIKKDLVPHMKSLTVQQGTPVTLGDTNSEVVQTSQGLYTETAHEDSGYVELNILERIVNGSEEPRHLDLALLQSITENFSEKKTIGSGGCGIVYEGILRNGIIAVKRLLNTRTIKDKMFHREVLSLISLKHQNIVRFLGYCSFTEEHTILSGGRPIMADIRERLLCFEYIRNGSLVKYLTDELRGLEWQTRYQIIIGICEGMHYLHKDKGIIHMDLKPGNILLDDLMVPKITDFGLSRPDSYSKATTTLLISQGYAAPEYISGSKATKKSDIYSLGVIIIELVTGSRTKPNITKVLRRWNHRWNKSTKQSLLGYIQVQKCLELALRCIQDIPIDRPDISDIIDELKETDTTDGQTPIQISPCCLEDILGVEPLEIHIPFEDLKIPHSIELTNETDDYIAFVTKAKLECVCTEPDRGIVPRRSKCTVTLVVQARVTAQSNEHYTEVITVLSTRVDDGALATMDIVNAGDIFIDRKEGKVVDEVNVMVVFGTPELPEEE